MLSGAVKRIRRTRPARATSTHSLDDDNHWDIGRWEGDDDGAKSTDKIVPTGAPNDIARIAGEIGRRWYPANENPRWPDNFHSKAKAMKKDCGEAFRVELTLTRALTTQLICSLSGLELKVMLFVLNRTWFWKKPREGIPASQFMHGVFIGGRQIQAPIATSPDHLHQACDQLERKGFIRISTASCEHGYVNVFEIDVGRVITMAEGIKLAARKPLSRREKLRERFR